MLPFSIALKPGEPVHEQILSAVREALLSGQLRDGDRFPSARALAQELRISPSAAGKVVSRLRDDGLLAEQEGSTLMVRAVEGSGVVPPIAGLSEMATVAFVQPPRATNGPAVPYPFLSPAPSGRSGGGEIPLGMIGGYEVMRLIGRGGMGMVFEALDRALMRRVAIKVLAPQLAASEEARARFLREARSAAAVDSESVLPIHAIGESDGFPYLVMPLVNGGSLQDVLDRGGPMPLSEVCRIGAKVADGLAAAHASGLMHRDIKPDNILLESGGPRVWIADFGLARAAEDVGLTMTGMVAVTPSYASPEQARGDAVDHRTDLFSLGSVIYTMVTGAPPFTGGSALAVLRKIEEQPAPDPRDVRPEVPVELARLILELLEKDPAGRPSGAEAVSSRLGECWKRGG